MYLLALALALPAPLAAGGESNLPPSKAGRKTLGSTLSDWTFTSLPACRILDTRPGSGVQGAGTGPLAAGSVTAIDVAGGAASSCGVPFPFAKAAVLNFVAVGPAGPGDLRAWPWDSSSPPPPNASVLNYAAVGGLNIANGLVVPICNNATATGNVCTFDLFLRPDISAVHVVIDVLGYFSPPAATAPDCLEVHSSTTLEPGATRFYTSPDCPAGYNLTGGGALTPNGGVVLVNSFPVFDVTGNGWRCSQTNNNTGAADVSCYAVCCRIPGH